jgi:hypothetical protein
MSWEKERVRDVFSDVRVSCPCGEGDHLPFIDQGEGDLQACHTV